METNAENIMLLNNDYLYHYKAKVISVYDGDTIRVEIDLGFGFKWCGSDGKGVSVRLAELNAPEVKGEERDAGLVSRDFLRSLILGKDITLKTIKDASGKYGRYLGIIFLEDININERLIQEGMAVRAQY